MGGGDTDGATEESRPASGRGVPPGDGSSRAGPRPPLFSITRPFINPKYCVSLVKSKIIYKYIVDLNWFYFIFLCENFD